MNDFELEFVMSKLGYECEVKNGRAVNENQQAALDRVAACIEAVDESRKQLKAKGIDQEGNILLQSGGKLLSGTVFVAETIAEKARKQGWKISKRFSLHSAVAIERKG